MGADQVGYLVKGPKTITNAAYATAISDFAKKVEQMRKLGKITCPDCGHVTDWDKDTDEDEVCANCDSDVIGAISCLTSNVKARAYAADLLNAWPLHARDCTSVPDPDDPDKILMFAGEMTWGDTPQGFGYQTLHKLMSSGIGQSVGIK